jgi:hypothetical protein
MSAETLRLLRAYEALPPQEQQAFVGELFRRRPALDLCERGIEPAQASDLRARLKTFAEDWDRPEMSVYDDEAASR